MKASDISRALASIIPTRQPVLILGAPGLGKSSLVFQAAAAVHDGETFQSTVGGSPDVSWFYTIRALDRDPVDFTGLPYVKGDQMYRSKPDMLAALRPEGGVIVIEELPQALPAVQCVLRELLLDRRVGGHKIPDTWTVMATGNRASDRAGSAKLLTHVASACVILEMESSVEDWQSWALNAGVASEVRSFIGFKPSALHSFDAARLVNTDPRGWERVSKVSATLPEDLLLPVLSGIVESGHAAEFISFRKLYHQLPDPKMILASPTTSSVPTDQAVLYALTGALTEQIRAAATPTQTLTAFVQYVTRLPKVFAALAMRDGTALQPRIIGLPVAASWLRENRALLLGK